MPNWDDHCMPMPLGVLCRMELSFPGRDTERIHRRCELRDLCESQNSLCEKRCHLNCVVQYPDNNGHPQDPCPEGDWICTLHDNALWIAAVLRIPAGRGTWRR